MPTLDFSLLVDVRCRAGESPVYDVREEALFFVDIPARRLCRFALVTGARREWICASEIASIGLCRTPGRLVMAQRSAVGIFELATGVFSPIAVIDLGDAAVRLNDGKVGPDGAFYVGGFDQSQPRRPVTGLWRVGPDGDLRQITDGVAASNGLAWSPDGGTLYHADTAARRIDAWEFDRATGAARNRRTFANLTDAIGRPDGAAVDVDGCYWSAGVSAGRLNRFAPDGRLIGFFPTPVIAPSMPCFGGPGLRTLFVTSLTEGRDPAALATSPWSGGVIAAPAPAAGVPVPYFSA